MRNGRAVHRHAFHRDRDAIPGNADQVLEDRRESARHVWIDQVVEQASETFKAYSETVGNSATALRERVTGQRLCTIRLNSKRKEAVGD